MTHSALPSQRVKCCNWRRRGQWITSWCFINQCLQPCLGLFSSEIRTNFDILVWDKSGRYLFSLTSLSSFSLLYFNRQLHHISPQFFHFWSLAARAGVVISGYIRRYLSSGLRTFRELILKGKDEHVSVLGVASIGHLCTSLPVPAEEPTPSPQEETTCFLLHSHFTPRR